MNTIPPLTSRLMSPEPLTSDDIRKLHKENPTSTIVNALYRAICSQSRQNVEKSSTSTLWIIDEETKKPLFISKGSFLSEHTDYRVPYDGGMLRERLYYLMDTNSFAGVPPTFIVKDHWGHVSWQLAIDGSPGHTITQDSLQSFRRCLIHQIRTVNLDPDIDNILVASLPNKQIIPIDGGYTLPFDFGQKNSLIDIDQKISKITYRGSIFACPKLDEPFSAEEITYIQNIDLKKDQELLQSFLSGEPEYLQTIRICKIANLILKEALNHSVITLHDVRIIYDLCFPLMRLIFPKNTVGREEMEIKSLFLHTVAVKKFILSLRPTELSEIQLHNITITTLKNFPNHLLPQEQKRHQFYKTLAAYYILGSDRYVSNATSKGNIELYKALNSI